MRDSGFRGQVVVGETRRDPAYVDAHGVRGDAQDPANVPVRGRAFTGQDTHDLGLTSGQGDLHGRFHESRHLGGGKPIASAASLYGPRQNFHCHWKLYSQLASKSFMAGSLRKNPSRISINATTSATLGFAS